MRQRHQFEDEFKWAAITGANEEVYRALLDLLLASPAKFSAFVADRHVADPVSRFGDTFRAYEKLATQLLIGSVSPYEIVSVLADNYSAPVTRSFEQTVKRECNWRLKRLAVASVVQVDSEATEGLQLVDVLAGAVGHSFRIMTGDASPSSRKGRMAADLRTKLGNADFNNGFKSREFMVKLYEHEKWLRRQQAALTVGHPPTYSTGTADVTSS